MIPPISLFQRHSYKKIQRQRERNAFLVRRVPVYSVTTLLGRGSRSLDGPACLPACRQVARSHTCKRPLYLRFKRGPFCVVVILHLIVLLSHSLSRRRRPSATYLATSLSPHPAALATPSLALSSFSRFFFSSHLHCLLLHLLLLLFLLPPPSPPFTFHTPLFPDTSLSTRLTPPLVAYLESSITCI